MKLSTKSFILFLILLSIVIGFAGFHNVDMCHNMQIMNLQYNLSFGENGIVMKNWNGFDCYAFSMSMIFYSVVSLSWVSCMLLLFHSTEKSKK